MGLYPAKCITCKRDFLWFSDALIQECFSCSQKTIEITEQDLVIAVEKVLGTGFSGSVIWQELLKIAKERK